MKNKKFLLLLFICLALLGLFHKEIMKIAYPRKYSQFVRVYAERYNLDENLIYAVIKAESKFNPKAVSRKNAKGLMQLTDFTATWAAGSLDYKEYDIFDPKTNIEMGSWYLDKLFKEFNDTDLVVMAYNGGSGNLNKWLKDPKLSKDGVIKQVPFKETSIYIEKVKRYYNMYKYLYEKAGRDVK